MLSHSKALCLAPQTQQQWEVLKMLLLKLFSVLTLKRDEKSLMNCRIYKIGLLYCSVCQSAEQKYFVLNPRTLECNTVEAMLPDPQTFTILQNQNFSSRHKPLVPTNSGEGSKSACKKNPGLYSIIFNKHHNLCISVKSLNLRTSKYQSIKRFLNFVHTWKRTRFNRGWNLTCS